MSLMKLTPIFLAATLCTAYAVEPLESRIENGYATNDGVKIHFAALGPTGF